MQSIVIATSNQHKRDEMVALAEGVSVQWKVLTDFPACVAPDEIGVTFRQNAELKALYYARHFDSLVLADDSGLCVDVLGGQPGIYSARFAGREASDGQNNELLMSRMRSVPMVRRSAYYVCGLALADANGVRRYCEGRWQGRVAANARGNGGFGYDSLFVPQDYSETVAQLPAQLKSDLSHRAVAMREMVRYIGLQHG